MQGASELFHRTLPCEGGVDDRAGLFDLVESVQGSHEYCSLEGDVVAPAHGMAHWEGYVEAAGRLDALGYLACDGDADGWYAHGLDGALDQPHGLVADTSARCEHYDIHALGLEV